MSYILDALKKSELERRGPSASGHGPVRSVAPTVSAAPAAPVRRDSSNRNLGRWYWIFGGALLVNGGITLYHHYSDPRHQNTVTSPTNKLADHEKARLIPTDHVARQTAFDNAATAPTAVNDASGEPVIPLLKDKPATFRQAVPKMNVDLHVYAERPRERFALINMSKFREGDDIGRGLVLESITPSGLVIRLNDDRFRIDTRY